MVDHEGCLVGRIIVILPIFYILILKRGKNRVIIIKKRGKIYAIQIEKRGKMAYNLFGGKSSCLEKTQLQ